MSLSDTNHDGKIHKPLKTIKREKNSKRERKRGWMHWDRYILRRDIYN